MGYESRGIPLDTLVTDMDWHITFYKEAAEGETDQVRFHVTGYTCHVTCHVTGWREHWMDWLHMGQASFP